MARGDSAFDRPLHSGASHLRTTEAQQRETPDVEGLALSVNQAQRQPADVFKVGVVQAAAGDGSHGGDRYIDKDVAIDNPEHSHILLGMARREFTAEVTVSCSPERAFDYFADHRHVAAVLEGVSRWEPAGKKTTGVGARYKVEMQALGMPLRSELRLNRWSRPHEIGWVSESGLIRQEGGFTFKKVKDGVRIELRIAYEPPASFVGGAIAGRLDWVIRGRLQKALERIRTVLEAES